MPAGKHKSRRYRRIFVRTPGSKVKIHYRERKPQRAHCATCGKPLSGVPRERSNKMSNFAKTAKRPERPYGGVYCSACTRVMFRQRVRLEK